MLNRMTEIERGLDPVPNYDEAMERSAPCGEQNNNNSNSNNNNDATPDVPPPVYVRTESGEADAASVVSVFVPPPYEEALKHEVILAVASGAGEQQLPRDEELSSEEGGEVNLAFQADREEPLESGDDSEEEEEEVPQEDSDSQASSSVTNNSSAVM